MTQPKIFTKDQTIALVTQATSTLSDEVIAMLSRLNLSDGQRKIAAEFLTTRSGAIQNQADKIVAHAMGWPSKRELDQFELNTLRAFVASAEHDGVRPADAGRFQAARARIAAIEGEART